VFHPLCACNAGCTNKGFAWNNRYLKQRRKPHAFDAPVQAF
jgi:hypothetical protein